MSRPRNISDEQILAEARQCFVAQGPAVPTQTIADRLGISHAVLFQRFKTKELLMRAALTPPASPAWVERLQRGPDDRPVRAQLLELATEIHGFFESVIPCIAMLRATGTQPFAEIERPEDRPPVRARRELAAWFARLQDAGRLGGASPDHLADLLLGALQMRPFQQHVAGRAPSEAHRADDHAFAEFAVDAVLAVTRPKVRRTAGKTKRRSARGGTR